jgi:hypothetical protein
MEATMLDSFLVHCPVKHHFTDGVYVREVFYQRDSCYVKIHKTEHQFILKESALFGLMVWRKF